MTLPSALLVVIFLLVLHFHKLTVKIAYHKI